MRVPLVPVRPLELGQDVLGGGLERRRRLQKGADLHDDVGQEGRDGVGEGEDHGAQAQQPRVLPNQERAVQEPARPSPLRRDPQLRGELRHERADLLPAVEAAADQSAQRLGGLVPHLDPLVGEEAGEHGAHSGRDELAVGQDGEEVEEGQHLEEVEPAQLQLPVLLRPRAAEEVEEGGDGVAGDLEEGERVRQRVQQSAQLLLLHRIPLRQDGLPEEQQLRGEADELGGAGQELGQDFDPAHDALALGGGQRGELGVAAGGEAVELREEGLPGGGAEDGGERALLREDRHEEAGHAGAQHLEGTGDLRGEQRKQCGLHAGHAPGSVEERAVQQQQTHGRRVARVRRGEQLGEEPAPQPQEAPGVSLEEEAADEGGPVGRGLLADERDALEEGRRHHGLQPRHLVPLPVIGAQEHPSRQLQPQALLRLERRRHEARNPRGEVGERLRPVGLGEALEQVLHGQPELLRVLALLQRQKGDQRLGVLLLGEPAPDQLVLVVPFLRSLLLLGWGEHLQVRRPHPRVPHRRVHEGDVIPLRLGGQPVGRQIGTEHAEPLVLLTLSEFQSQLSVSRLQRELLELGGDVREARLLEGAALELDDALQHADGRVAHGGRVVREHRQQRRHQVRRPREGRVRHCGQDGEGELEEEGGGRALHELDQVGHELEVSGEVFLLISLPHFPRDGQLLRRHGLAQAVQRQGARVRGEGRRLRVGEAHVLADGGEDGAEQVDDRLLVRVRGRQQRGKQARQEVWVAADVLEQHELVEEHRVQRALQPLARRVGGQERQQPREEDAAAEQEAGEAVVQLQLRELARGGVLGGGEVQEVLHQRLLAAGEQARVLLPAHAVVRRLQPVQQVGLRVAGLVAHAHGQQLLHLLEDAHVAPARGRGRRPEQGVQDGDQRVHRLRLVLPLREQLARHGVDQREDGVHSERAEPQRRLVAGDRARAEVGQVRGQQAVVLRQRRFFRPLEPDGGGLQGGVDQRERVLDFVLAQDQRPIREPAHLVQLGEQELREEGLRPRHLLLGGDVPLRLDLLLGEEGAPVGQEVPLGGAGVQVQPHVVLGGEVGPAQTGDDVVEEAGGHLVDLLAARVPRQSEHVPHLLQVRQGVAAAVLQHGGQQLQVPLDLRVPALLALQLDLLRHSAHALEAVREEEPGRQLAVPARGHVRDDDGVGAGAGLVDGAAHAGGELEDLAHGGVEERARAGGEQDGEAEGEEHHNAGLQRHARLHRVDVRPRLHPLQLAQRHEGGGALQEVEHLGDELQQEVLQQARLRGDLPALRGAVHQWDAGHQLRDHLQRERRLERVVHVQAGQDGGEQRDHVRAALGEVGLSGGEAGGHGVEAGQQRREAVRLRHGDQRLLGLLDHLRHEEARAQSAERAQGRGHLQLVLLLLREERQPQRRQQSPRERVHVLLAQLKLRRNAQTGRHGLGAGLHGAPVHELGDERGEQREQALQVAPVVGRVEEGLQGAHQLLQVLQGTGARADGVDDQLGEEFGREEGARAEFVRTHRDADTLQQLVEQLVQVWRPVCPAYRVWRQAGEQFQHLPVPAGQDGSGVEPESGDVVEPQPPGLLWAAHRQEGREQGQHVGVGVGGEGGVQLGVQLGEDLPRGLGREVEGGGGDELDDGVQQVPVGGLSHEQGLLLHAEVQLVERTPGEREVGGGEEFVRAQQFEERPETRVERVPRQHVVAAYAEADADERHVVALGEVSPVAPHELQQLREHALARVARVELNRVRQRPLQNGEVVADLSLQQRPVGQVLLEQVRLLEGRPAGLWAVLGLCHCVALGLVTDTH